MDNWRLILSEAKSGAMNMAIDEAIIKSVSEKNTPPTIRFYQWSQPTVTLGYFQSLEKEVDIESCKSEGVDIIRRLTGGRAVLHHNEFTYSLIASEKNEKIAGSVLKSYQAISQGLLKGLKSLGLDAQLTEGKKMLGKQSAACFDAPSWYELVVGGKKLIGSAQTRRFGSTLQHGSLPRELHVDLLFSLLNFKSEKHRSRAKKYLQAKATSLSEVLDYRPSFNKLSNAFKKGFEAGLDINLSIDNLTEEELSLAEDLYTTKYSIDKWNSRR